ncbi:MAG: threonine/serine exporter family protein [Rikenellaceae bacterium]
MENFKQDQDTLLLRRKLYLLLRAGKLLIESAADTNRVERNMKRVAAFLGIPEDKLHIDIRWTMLIVNVSDESHSFSKFQKCEHHGVNMTTITDISRLSWRAIEQDYSIDRFEEELEAIATRPRNYRPYLVAIGAGFACGGFCKLFGCDWIAFLIASLCAFVGFRTRARCFEFGINHYVSIAIAAFVSTCMAFLSTFMDISSTPYHPLLACALFLVPGVPLINFVDDMIDNFLLVGMTRASNCMMIIGSMTFGITMSLGLSGLRDVSIDQKFSELSMVPHDGYLAYAVAAAIAAVGFSMIFNVPRRALWAIALGGIIAVCTRNFVNFDLGCGPVMGSFMGSFIVTLIAVKAVHWFHVPIHILTIPSVIPMIPGVLLYRFLLGLVHVSKGNIDTITTLTNGVNAALIILVISIGVAVPNIFARRYIARDRRKRLETMLEERRKRGNFLSWER